MAAAAACMITPAAARPLLPTPRRLAGRPSERSGWENKKMPGRASASTSWTKDKLVARTSATVPIPSRASLSDSWTKDKTERKEASVRVGRPPSREESPVKGKRASSRALSVVVERSEKKAKPEENAEAEAKKLDEDVVEAVFYAGPAFRGASAAEVSFAREVAGAERPACSLVSDDEGTQGNEVVSAEGTQGNEETQHMKQQQRP
nr:unnamed protein product [Digitaria exilis]